MFKSLALTALAAAAVQRVAAWPDTPFYTEGRYVYDECGNEVRFAGVNWPGASETMLPEGLQYASIADIVTKIKGLGLNIIRLTYAMQMVDEEIEGSPSSTLYNTVHNALDPYGDKVLQQILAKNPQFTANTTRLEVFDAVAAECAKQELWIHLDNHQSKASWCCPQWDGNAWFNDTNFNVYNWTRGLGFMAEHTKSWDALVSMSLRNELRPPLSPHPALPYGWAEWLNNMIPAAEAIYSNNSLPLIYFSGINWDTTDSLMVTGKSDNLTFNPLDYDFGEKVVYEIHDYAQTTCDGIISGLYSSAYGAMNTSDAATYPNQKPVVLSEFGFDQTDGSYNSVYAQCLKNYLSTFPGGPGSWMQWVLAGSYYIRLGSPDFDETWGLLSHDWSEYRNQTVLDLYVKPFVEATLAGL